MKKASYDFLPIILGSDENAYACARMFFDEYGIKPLLLCATPLNATKYSKILTLETVPNLDLPSVFECRIPRKLRELKETYKKLLLIPCSDYYTELLADIAPEIQKYAENPLISKELLHSFSDKAAFSALSERLGFSHPKTVVTHPSELDIATLPFDYPIILKPANSNSGDYLRAQIPNKKKAYVCHTPAELDRLLQGFRRCGFDQSIVLQHFIPGGCENMYVVNAYSDGNGRVRLIGAAQVLLDYTDPKSLGNYLALRPTANRPLCDRAAEILESIGYVGFANFDIKKSPETEEYYFLELNPRPGRSSYYLCTAGENPMKELTDDSVYSVKFKERRYAEKDGVWSTLPKAFLSKRLSPEILSTPNFGYALKSPLDRSLLRSVSLARRNYTVAKNNLLFL